MSSCADVLIKRKKGSRIGSWEYFTRFSAPIYDLSLGPYLLISTSAHCHISTLVLFELPVGVGGFQLTQGMGFASLFCFLDAFFVGLFGFVLQV